MRRNFMLGVAVGAVIVLGSAGGAFAGEFNGNGDPTGGPSHANSPCAYSGLEDHETDGSGVEPGTTQNWGQFDQADRKAFSERGGGASDVLIPGLGEWGCNANLHGMK